MAPIPRAGLVSAYVAWLAVVTGVLLWSTVGAGAAPGQGPVGALAVLALLVAAAEYLQVRVRLGREVESLTLVEAVVLPLIWAYPPWQATLAVAVGQCAAAVARRNSPLKSAFNITQWSLATAAGGALLQTFGHAGVGPRSTGLLLLCVAVIAGVNNLAFLGILGLTTHGRPSEVVRELGGLHLPGWAGSVGLNAAIGLLFVLAFEGSPAAVVLFVVPLGVLHLAYRGQASAHTDRARLAGLHRAAAALTAPLDPRDALSTYLREVATTFGARLVVLVLRTDSGREVHRLERDVAGILPATAHALLEPIDTATLAGALSSLPGPVAVTAGEHDPLGRQLAEEGGRDCLAAPLLDDDRLLGALLVVDRQGIEGETAGELAVVESLAREAAGAFTKGRLLTRVLEERRKLDRIVSTTSDGIASLDGEGLVRSWNPAMERLTGLTAHDVVGVPGALDRLGLRTTSDEAVLLSGWRDGAPLPVDLRVSSPTGPRRLSCSYSTSEGDGGDPTLVVVARDVSPAEEMRELREQFGRMVEQEAAQRLVVEHLQEAVMPPRPDLPQLALGVSYVASDPSEPTGGDLYDCQLLPTGQLYLAVVDVVGHGVRATQDALAVVHTLRTVVLDGTPLHEVVGRADTVLGRRDTELVATVVLALYEPETGRLVVASGGHPPALVVSAGGGVVQLEASGGAIGWPNAGSERLAETTLGPGDTLILYTDGLVEAGKDIVAGLEALAANAGRVAALPAAELATALVETSLAGAERRDDTLALVLRRHASTVAPGPDRAAWRLGRNPHLVGAVRRAATGWLAERGIPTVDAALVVGELLANAVTAARDEVDLSIDLAGGAVVVEVRDDGPGFEGPVPASQDPTRERGRGLQIVGSIAELEVESTSTGSRIVATLPLVTAAPGA